MSILGVVAALLVAPPPSVARDRHPVFADGTHNSNTAALRLDDGRLLFAFRGGASGQSGSGKARIVVGESTDDLATPCDGRASGGCRILATLEMPRDKQGHRDIRDPKLVWFKGRLFLYAISRRPGLGVRNMLADSWTMRSQSTDGGRTWSPLEKTIDETPFGDGASISGWRYVTRRFRRLGQEHERLYASAYNDGSYVVWWMSSDDGEHFTPRGRILTSMDASPSEAEFVFYGDNDEHAVALVRSDDQGILESGHTEVCYGEAPLLDMPSLEWSWRCRHRLEQRLDGAAALVPPAAGEPPRLIVAARKHLACTRKSMAIYELRDVFGDPRRPPELCELDDLAGIGDPGYGAWATSTTGHDLLLWQSGKAELPWLESHFLPTDIWAARVELPPATAPCRPAAADLACNRPPLPDAGRHPFERDSLLVLRTVHWSGGSGLDNFGFFRMHVRDGGRDIDLTIQPLRQDAYLGEHAMVAEGAPWLASAVAVDSEGRFTVTFDRALLPGPTLPIMDETMTYDLHDVTITGQTLPDGRLCGHFDGIFEFMPGYANYVLLDGSSLAGVPLSEAGSSPYPFCD